MMNNQMNTKRQQSRDRESLAFRTRFAALAALVGVLLAWLAPSPPAQSQGIPPECAPSSKTGTNPCGTVGVSCQEKSEPCSSPSQTTVTTYCCVEEPLNNCRAYVGRWYCCNGVWKPWCLRINQDGDNTNCGGDGHCYGL